MSDVSQTSASLDEDDHPELLDGLMGCPGAEPFARAILAGELDLAAKEMSLLMKHLSDASVAGFASWLYFGTIGKQVSGPPRDAATVEREVSWRYGDDRIVRGIRAGAPRAGEEANAAEGRGASRLRPESPDTPGLPLPMSPCGWRSAVAILEVPYIYLVQGIRARCRVEEAVPVVGTVLVRIPEADHAPIVATWRGSDGGPREVAYRAHDGLLWEPAGRSCTEIDLAGYGRQAREWAMRATRGRFVDPFRERLPCAGSWLARSGGHTGLEKEPVLERDLDMRELAATSQAAYGARTAMIAAGAFLSVGGFLYRQSHGPLWQPFHDGDGPPGDWSEATVVRLRPDLGWASPDVVFPADDAERALAFLRRTCRVGSLSDDATVDVADPGAFREARPSAEALVLHAAACDIDRRVGWDVLSRMSREVMESAVALRGLAESHAIVRGRAGVDAAAAHVGRINRAFPQFVTVRFKTFAAANPVADVVPVLSWLRANPSRPLDVEAPAPGRR
jgi:hypothetical protein